MTDKRPRDRRRERVRRSFVDAARKIAAEQGPEKLSLRGVARESDYSHAALYEYFQSREALLGAVIYDGFRELMSKLGAVRGGVTQRTLTGYGTDLCRICSTVARNF